VPRPLQLLFVGRAIQFWVDVEALETGVLLLLHNKRVSFRVSILSLPGYLPGDLHIRSAGTDGELVVLNFACQDRLRKLPDYSQLIAEVGVQRLKPFRQLDDRFTLRIGCDDAVVDVLHLGRFNGGVHQVLVRRVERMVDFEILGAGEDLAGD
jgi:hypothetical protein